MRNRLGLFIFANCLLLGVSFLQANAFKVIDHDLMAAPSHHSNSWSKGDEEEFFGEAEEDKGEKGEKGYESKHG